MTYGDWDKVIAAMPLSQAKAVKAALATLRGWEPFEREFKGFGLFGLEITLAYEIEHQRTLDRQLRMRPAEGARWFNSKTREFEPVPADSQEVSR